LVNLNVGANGRVLTMHFPPRVNGQTASDGDGHADMYVLFYSDTLLPVDQPRIVEAVPKNAAGAGVSVSDLDARNFSAIWELHAVLVDPTYDPKNPVTLIDSAAKVTGPGASPFVHAIYQINIFLNCPVVPAGTIVDPALGGPQFPVLPAFFQGHVIYFVPYDIEDGPFNPQILFKFVDANGNVLPSAASPLLVASKAPGDPFYSSIWELWTVRVPLGFDVTAIKSADDVKNSGFPITSSGIRLNCPVVAVDGVPLPFEDAFALMTDSSGRFDIGKFPFDVPSTPFSKPRTHLITEVSFPVAGPAPASATAAPFPPIDPDGKGNVIPVILRDPFQLQSSGPNTTGDFIRIDQPDLDAAYLNNSPPRLPAAIETNFARLIGAGLLAPDWAPGAGRSYQERLAVVGRALFELVWKPEQGANQRDVTRCYACHSTPSSGGAARGLYTFEVGPSVGDDVRALFNVPLGAPLQLNAGSMYGSGGAELLNNQMKARGVSNITSAHGAQGSIDTIRGDVSSAFFLHTGIMSNEEIVSLQPAAIAAGCDTNHDGVVTLDEAAQCDLDGDGVVNELTVGEVTAVTVFFMTLRAPDQLRNDPNLLALMGIPAASIDRGRNLFINPVDQGGAACASCHTPFQPLTGTQFVLTNPQTAFGLPLQVSFHVATPDEVTRGFATSVGQAGLRLYGDFKPHKMGARMFCSGTDSAKTAELWDVGSVFPYGRCGFFGSSLNDVILAHEGVSLSSVMVTKDPQFDFVDSAQIKKSSQRVTVKNTSSVAVAGPPAKPIRVTLVGKMTTGIRAANAVGTDPAGGRRQGAFWLINNDIPAGGSAMLTLEFENPSSQPLDYALAILDDVGDSEAVASAHAYRTLLSDSDRSDLINFLRVQLIDGKVGEGSGGNGK